ncbi:hypothetical protein Daus18300_008412 [Diaporthe australafricana]|uniref:Autophagy-related protein 1 n=1 Tax=Diaporthe australafricana TaxID=127596 RepID=A0ABR3WI26_9PEZI
MTALAVLPELARDSQLATAVTSDCCMHFFAETPTSTRKEVWKRTKRLGSGGYGTVWLEICVEGQDIDVNNKCRAVKVLQLPTDAPVAEAVSRYGRELEALAKFSQRKSYGWYEDAPSSSISICLEFLPLGDLQAFIAKRADPKLPEPEVQQIVSQVLDGLVFMHVEGFAHRDLKPAVSAVAGRVPDRRGAYVRYISTQNILIKSHSPDDWWIKLSDFGLSKRTEVSSGTIGIQGTPSFMAPELWGYIANDQLSRTAMAYPADMWSLGEIAFQLATGRPTFPRPAMLVKYTLGQCGFPVFQLQKAAVSQAMVDFITGTMLANYTQRPTAETASTHPWLGGLKREALPLHGSLRFDAR